MHTDVQVEAPCYAEQPHCGCEESQYGSDGDLRRLLSS
jgi:hypothetical protein